MENPRLLIEWFEEIDSTSRVARAYLSGGGQDVTAFVARTQSKGVGQLGRGWESLDGNLHMSLAFPAGVVRTEIRDILPLATGVVIAQWIARTTGATPVLKWPNDIVMGGAKVGGILCETSITGDQWNGVVIGIGLNLLAFPKLKDAEYEASSIEIATGVKRVARLSAEVLARELASFLGGTARETILTLYEQHATSSGQPWVDEQGRWWQQEAFGADGALCLSRRTEGKITIHSSQHHYRWAGLTSQKQLVCDIGNSRVKIGLCEIDNTKVKVAKSMSTAQDLSHEILSWLSEQIQKGVPPIIHAVSVHDERAKYLEAQLAELNVRLRIVRKLPVRNVKSCYDLSQIGLDRMAAVEAALALKQWHGWNSGVVVASFGTATTLDFILPAGDHLGGFIGVGIATGLQALHEKTGKLPAVQPNEYREFNHYPSQTDQAMAAAATRMQGSWLSREVEEFASGQSLAIDDLQVLMTGGLGRFVERDLGPKARFRSCWEPDLVLLGTSLMALGRA